MQLYISTNGVIKTVFHTNFESFTRRRREPKKVIPRNLLTAFHDNARGKHKSMNRMTCENIYWRQ